MTVINNILDISKIEVGNETPEAAPFNLDDVVGSIADLMELIDGRCWWS